MVANKVGVVTGMGVDMMRESCSGQCAHSIHGYNTHASLGQAIGRRLVGNRGVQDDTMVSTEGLQFLGREESSVVRVQDKVQKVAGHTDGQVEAFEDVLQELLAMVWLRDLDPVDPAIVGEAVDDDHKGVNTTKETFAEGLGVDDEVLARPGKEGKRRVRTGEGNTVHTPVEARFALGHQCRIHQPDVVWESFEHALGDEIPQAVVPHVVQPLMPEDEGVHCLRHREEGGNR